MTGMQQLDQAGGPREYIPRHAWVEPADEPAVEAGTAPLAAAPPSSALLYEAASTEAVAGEPARTVQPYQLVESSTDYVTVEPERKRLWRSRKTA